LEGKGTVANLLELVNAIHSPCISTMRAGLPPIASAIPRVPVAPIM
jgi:hypothetical protein